MQRQMRQASIGANQGSAYLSDASTRSQPYRIVSIWRSDLAFISFGCGGKEDPFLSPLLSPVLTPLFSPLSSPLSSPLYKWPNLM